MSKKVILGKHCLVKFIYNNAPITLRIEKFDEKDGAELRKRQLLGRTAPETDRIENGWSGSMTVLQDGRELDTIVADIQARDAANLPARDLAVTLTEVFRDGATLPQTTTYQGFVFTVDKGFGSRTDDVKREIKWEAEKRVIA